jgi:hypothetical protein
MSRAGIERAAIAFDQINEQLVRENPHALAKRSSTHTLRGK